MNNVKKSLLQEIADKVKRKKALSQEIAARRVNVEEFVLKMISEVDEMTSKTVNKSISPMLAEYYIRTIHQRLRVLDKDIKIEPSWHQAPDETDRVPQLNGILIKWSKEYQAKNSCDPELFVDVVSLLFK